MKEGYGNRNRRVRERKRKGTVGEDVEYISRQKGLEEKYKGMQKNMLVLDGLFVYATLTALQGLGKIE